MSPISNRHDIGTSITITNSMKKKSQTMRICRKMRNSSNSRNMKAQVKKLIPNTLLPQARSFYVTIVNAIAKARFSRRQYAELSALKCSVSYNQYGGYCVPESSRHRLAAQRILANDVHEPETIEFMTASCGDGDIVHAGAYFGDFLPALSAGCAQDSRIWAFEPNAENYRCARITMEINGIANVELANAGLGARREILRLKTTDSKGVALGGTSRIIPDTE